MGELSLNSKFLVTNGSKVSIDLVDAKDCLTLATNFMFSTNFSA